MIIKELEGSLQAHRERMKRRQEESLEQSLKVQAFLKHNERFKSQQGRARGRGHGREQGGRGHAYAQGGKGNGNNDSNNKKESLRKSKKSWLYSK